MSVVTGALGSLAPKLLQLLHGEYKLQKGVRKQVQWLHSELESISPFLHKVSDVPWNQLDEQVKVWAREVREASYDMEDILDTFLVRVDSGKHGDTSSLMNKMGDLFKKAKARRDIAGKIEDMTKRLEEVAGRRQRYKLDEIMYKQGTSTSSIDPRLKAMHKEVTQFIGVDKSKDKLISMLSPSNMSDKKMKKVSIVGVGGLGKTTLAKVVYDMLKSQFDCGAFVSIGRNYNLEKVFKDILFDLDKVKYKDIHDTRRGLELLIREVREFLENKRYFVVIDDVWKVETWETIKMALAENNCGSKVITTTRNSEVAKEAGEVFALKPLPNDDSLKLFYTRIFGASGKWLHSQIDDTSDKIIKKCAGIPLAIITMASMFACKPECIWSEVYNSIGFDSKDNRESEDTMTILSFSYYDLPPHLRTCLLYLCTHPEDYLIEKKTLIWKWIAEGFIEQEQGTRLFDIGERYFNHLIDRSLIQVRELWGGIVLTCRVHDMILDLMRKLSCEENFIAILDGNIQGTFACSSVVRWLANQNRMAEHISSETIVTGIPKVRSYTALRCCIDNRDQFFRFELLRVLDLIECKFKKGCHLEHLGDLLHLRYLRIYDLDGDLELPREIGNLWLLQGLDVSGELPASIVQLTQLVRLDAQQAEAPHGIGNMTSLEELTIHVDGNPKIESFVKELSNLQELRVLRFRAGGMDESTQRHFVESLRSLKKIQHLEVLSQDTAVWEAAGFVLPRSLYYLNLFIHFSKLPSSISPSSLPNLSHLELMVNTMDEQDMENLARLLVLCCLILTLEDETMNAYYIKINIQDNCFQKLRYFLINEMVQFQQPNEKDGMVSLHRWNGEDAVPFGFRKGNDGNSRKLVPSALMPNLEVLDFNLPLRAMIDDNGDCGNIGLEYLPSLKHLILCIDCDGVSAKEVNAAVAALTNACKVHLNNPTHNIRRINKEKMVSTHDKKDEKQEEEVASQTADIDLGKLSQASS